MIAFLMIMLAATPAIQGNSSGKHNQAASGCGCHSNGGGITATNDFPTSYTAGQVYSINIGHAGAGTLVGGFNVVVNKGTCLLYTSPSPRDYAASRMPSSA